MQDTANDEVLLSPSRPQDLSGGLMRRLEEENGGSTEDSEESEASRRTTDSEEDEGGHDCLVCGERVPTQHLLTLHIRSHNSDGEVSPQGAECRVCGKVLGSAASLDRHVLVHSGERPFGCRICGTRFTTNGNMHRHMRSHGPEEAGRKRCHQESNNNEGETPHLKRKKRSRNQRMQGRYECPVCSEDFLGLHVLEIHLEESHPGYTARCAECNLEFKNYKVLNLHRFMVHYQEDEEVRDISIVDFSSGKFPLIAKAMLENPSLETREEKEEATDLTNKNDFLANLDLRKSPKKCDELAEDLDTILSNTNGHFMAGEVISGSTPSAALLDNTPPDSGSRFLEPEEEQDCFSAEFRRMKLRGEFPCRLCTNVFPNLRALKGHNRAHLQGPGPDFQCNMCPYSSNDKAALSRHMRTHNGDRPYECALCNYAFTTKANCERHLRNRHAASRIDLKKSIIYHPSEDPNNCLNSDSKEDVKRSLFPEDDDRKEVGTMTSEAPLDLSMDALDLSKKRAPDSPEEEPAPRRQQQPTVGSPYADLTVPTFYSAAAAAGGFPYPAFLPPYFLPPAALLFQNREFTEMKERLQKELIRNLSMAQLSESNKLAPKVGPKTAVQEPPKPKPPPDSPQNPSSSVKMVIKNGVLVPKQKQRRYRTERPFGCEHCTARFTLRSNMERHVKQQHPQFWSQRQRGGSGGGGGGGRRSKSAGSAGPNPGPTGPAPVPQAKEEEREHEAQISEGVRRAIVDQLKAKIQQGPQEPASEDLPSSVAVRPETDLASVSRLLDNASTQTFRQYFASEDGQENSDEEGLVASHSEENSGSDENKSESEAAPAKKKSAYSLAPNRVSCPYCFRKFPWSSSLRRHVLTHTGQKPFKCPFCPLLFTTKSNCDRHLLRKHAGSAETAAAPPTPGADPTGARNVPERPYKCKRCPSSTFSTLGNLRKHVCTKHEESGSEDEPPGGQCPTGVAVGASPLLGAGELPFKCHLCEGAFPERQEALDHLRTTHEQEYLALVNKGALESSCEEVDDPDEAGHHHERGKFPDYANRKVMCAFCLRRFWSAEDLRRHMRTHTGERPFSCDVCTRRFTLKHSMLRHRKKHTGAAPAPTTPAAPPSAPEATSDLIGNLLGIGDSHLVDSMLEQSADDAAKLLGVEKSP